MQKSNLATITVDGSSSAESSSARFTKEELRDCFTLKEDCNCDTKRKVGKRWPEYGKIGVATTHCNNYNSVSHSLVSNVIAGGAQDLESQDCNDAPLLSVAKTHSKTLRFIHEVTEEELVVPPDDGTGDVPMGGASDDDSSEEECEFVNDECDEGDDGMSGDSDEECEFDE